MNFIKSAFGQFITFGTLSIFEFCFQIYRASKNMPKYVSTSMLNVSPPVALQYIIFISKFMVLLLILSLFCEFLKNLLNIKNSYYFSIWTWIFSASLTLAIRPHFMFSSISAMSLFIFGGITCAACVGFFIFGNLPFFKKNEKIKTSNYFLAFFLMAMLALFNAPGTNFFDQILFRYNRQAASKNLNKSVLVVSIDSLRPEFVHRYASENPNSIFSKFYHESTVFNSMITPIARTHPSLISFLTGMNPPQHGVRENLMPDAKNTEKIFQKSNLLQQLYEKKFQTRFLIDENKFAQFNETQFLNIAKSPIDSVTNHVLPQIFKSSLHNIFFNNLFGHSILTELDGNGAYSATYNPKNFFYQISDVIKKLNLNEPFFILAHTCAMHYPGHSRSSYILKNQSDVNHLTTEYINYFSKEQNIENIHPEKFKDLAYGNFSMVIDDVIIPLLENLQQSHLSDQINIILMSDHGETFFSDSARYNSSYIPAHGGPAILNEDSYKSAFIIHSKNNKIKNVDQPTSLVDVSEFIQNIVSESKKNYKTDRGKYYESGIWSKSNFKSQLLYFDRNIEKLYSINEFGNVSLIEKIEPGLIVQKARTIFLEKKHYTLFPTDFGIESVTCEGYKCWSDREINQKFIDDINHFAKPDIEAGYWPRMINQKSSSADFEIDKKSNHTKNQFLTYLLLQHDLNHNGGIFDAVEGLLKILINPNNDQLLRKKSYQSLSEVCRIHFLKKLCSDFFDFKYSDRTFFLEKTPQSEIFVDNLIATSQFSALRDYADKYENNVFQTGYYYKFWLAYIQLPENLTLDQKIEKLKTTFEIELGLYFFEVDSDWVRFLNHVSSNSDRSYFYAEAAKYLKTGRLPLTVVFNDLLPAVMNITDSTCYNDKIHRLIFSRASEWMNRSNWSELVFEIAIANQHQCVRK